MDPVKKNSNTHKSRKLSEARDGFENMKSLEIHK